MSVGNDEQPLCLAVTVVSWFNKWPQVAESDIIPPKAQPHPPLMRWIQWIWERFSLPSRFIAAQPSVFLLFPVRCSHCPGRKYQKMMLMVSPAGSVFRYSKTVKYKYFVTVLKYIFQVSIHLSIHMQYFFCDSFFFSFYVSFVCQLFKELRIFTKSNSLYYHYCCRLRYSYLNSII